LKNGVVGGSKNGDFIGLMLFGVKMGVKISKNLHFFAFICIYLQKLTKMSRF
jgi:hypothetical protein